MIAVGKKLGGNTKENIIANLKLEFEKNINDVAKYESKLNMRVSNSTDTHKRLVALKDYATDLFGMSAQKIYKILIEEGVCYESLSNQPFISLEYADKGYCEVVEYTYPTYTGSGISYYLNWTLDGLRLIWITLQKRKNLKKEEAPEKRKTQITEELSLFDDLF